MQKINNSKTIASKKQTKNKTTNKKVSKKNAEQLQELKTQLLDAQKSAKENWNQLLRVKAEAENVKRRSTKDIENAHKYAIENFAKELLTIIDSMTIGLDSAKKDNANLTAVVEGMEIIIKSFNNTLNKFGIKKIDPKNETFNPQYHEAITMIESKNVDSQMIIEVMQAGFMINDRLLRPARVVIAK